MKTLSRLSFFIVISVFFSPHPVSAAFQDTDVAAAARANRAAKAAAVKAANAWFEATQVSLTAKTRFIDAAMTFENGSNHDLKITLNPLADGKDETGEILVINGQRQWILVRNVKLETGHEIDAVDVPVLTMTLVLELLRAAIPDGPASVTRQTPINLQEERHSILVRTPSANADLRAPWLVQGSVEPSGDGQYSFDLTAKHDDASHFSGTWLKGPAPPQFSDDMPLAGWRILSIGRIQRRNEDGSTALGFGVQPSNVHAMTLGELRAVPADPNQ